MLAPPLRVTRRHDVKTLRAFKPTEVASTCKPRDARVTLAHLLCQHEHHVAGEPEVAEGDLETLQLALQDGLEPAVVGEGSLLADAERAAELFTRALLDRMRAGVQSPAAVSKRLARLVYDGGSEAYPGRAALESALGVALGALLEEGDVKECLGICSVVPACDMKEVTNAGARIAPAHSHHH